MHTSFRRPYHALLALCSTHTISCVPSRSLQVASSLCGPVLHASFTLLYQATCVLTSTMDLFVATLAHFTTVFVTMPPKRVAQATIKTLERAALNNNPYRMSKEPTSSIYAE